MDSAATASVWHAGEKQIQRSAGVAERMEAVGRRNVRDFMPDQHRAFFAALPYLVVGSVDAGGAPWATILTGDPGFVASPTPTILEIAARPEAGDPVAAGLRDGAAVGLLGIELGTRRRNRVNGTLREVTPERLRIEVGQSFGNCPQYIRLRDIETGAPVRPPGAVEESDGLDEPARAAVAAADTFFVASYVEEDGSRHVDVSHRGGKPGFVRVADDGLLTIPDFSGNLFFMTLGNILANGKAGLAFPDWETGDMLQMTGDAAVLLDAPEVAAFRGAERLWTFRPHRVVRRRGALPLRWSAREDGSSPNSLTTGDWHEAIGRLEAEREAKAAASRWRPFRVARIVDESRSIRSYHLVPADGSGLAPYRAGQHLPVRLALADGGKPLMRTYTLSGAPTGLVYRISVKRDGLASRHLHDHIRAGDTIEARAPAGDFIIDPEATRPVVLLAGGIGITPLLAMLHALVDEGRRVGRVRPTYLLYAAHHKAERAFDREIADLAEDAEGAVRVMRVLGEGVGAREGEDYEALGRVDMALLSRHLPFGDYDFYLCGPPTFAQALYDGLRGLNVADDRIHAEAFGPSALRRSTATDAPGRPPRSPASTSPVRVLFTRTGRETQWHPGGGSLLELAEQAGLEPAFGCRSGSCGTCKARVAAGVITYLREPTAEAAEEEALICCAVPAQGTTDLRLAL